jgi:hypothetical protein
MVFSMHQTIYDYEQKGSVDACMDSMDLISSNREFI